MEEGKGNDKGFTQERSYCIFLAIEKGEVSILVCVYKHMVTVLKLV